MNNKTADLMDASDFDEEASILGHAIDYMNQADERARERLMFHLTHRYFPNGTFQPQRISSVDLFPVQK